jgi:hypothetical protein
MGTAERQTDWTSEELAADKRHMDRMHQSRDVRLASKNQRYLGRLLEYADREHAVFTPSACPVGGVASATETRDPVAL